MSTDDKNLVEELNVKEELDGSAVIELPDDIESPDEQDDDDHAEGVEVSASDDDDHEPEGETEMQRIRREKRRAKKNLAKQITSEKELKLQLLERQNRELLERLSVVERKTHSADLARIDKAIEDQELRLQYAKMKIAEAATNSDGTAMTDAQEMMYETRRQIEALRGLKESATKPQQQSAAMPDPRLQRLAATWMEKQDWYDPNGRDMDSRVAKQVDEALVAEGWNPNDKDYWDELDNRLQKYLPHRYNARTDVSSSSKRPRSVVTGSGREGVNSSSGRNTFTLQPEQVRAMKDAGFWDDPQKRAKMIKRYAQEARNNSR
jgi:hypothetical protein